MKKRLLAVCVILGLLGTLPVSAAAEQVWAGREMLWPGTGYADMLSAVQDKPFYDSTITEGETLLPVTADAAGELRLYASAATADSVEVTVLRADGQTAVAVLHFVPRTYLTYHVYGLEPGGTYLLQVTAQSSGRLLAY